MAPTAEVPLKTLGIDITLIYHIVCKQKILMDAHEYTVFAN